MMGLHTGHHMHHCSCRARSDRDGPVGLVPSRRHRRATREARDGREANSTGLESGCLGVNVNSAPAGQSQPLIDDTEEVLP